MKNTSAKLAQSIIFAIIIMCSGNAYAVQKCGVRMGYTTFASASGATGNTTYCANDIKFEGIASESFLVNYACGDPTASSTLNNGNYTIVNNLGWFNGNTRSIVAQSTDGTVVIDPNANSGNTNPVAVYAISGLTAGTTYHVRFIVSNIAIDNSNNWCNQQRMRPQFKVTRANGVTTSGGGLANGTMKTLTQPSPNGQTCNADIPVGGQGWDINNGGNQTLNPNGHRIQLECDVTVGGNGGTQWPGDNGFEIRFFANDGANDYVMGIEEIEVTTCVEQTISSSQGLDPCVGTPTTLTAIGWGLTSDVYEWKANGVVIAGATGYRYTVTPPEGVTTIYTVRNVTNPAEDPVSPITISITPANCCGATATRFTVPKVCSPPNVTDGNADDIAWNMAPWQPVALPCAIGGGNGDCNMTGGGAMGVVQNPAGRWRCIYDETNIYYLVEVNDPNPSNTHTATNDGANSIWYSDCIEIYLANANGSSQRQFGFGYDLANNKKYGSTNNTGRIFQSGAVWFLEIAIPLAANGYNTNSPYLLMELSIGQSRQGQTCRAAQLATWSTSGGHYNSSAAYTPAPLSSCASVVAAPDTVCAGGSVNLSTQMSAAGGTTYTWQQCMTENGTYVAIQGASTTPTATGELNNVVPTNGTPLTSGTIWYRALHGGVATCPARVVVQNGAVISNAVRDTVCAGNTAQIKANVSSGNINWFAASTGGTSIGTTASGVFWTTPVVNATTIYYAEPTDGTCANASRTPVTVLVPPDNTITLTSAASTTNQSICLGSPIVDITYSATGASNATITGLPPGITYAWSVGSGSIGTLRIHGTPSSATGSPFNYTVTLTGGCGNITATGTIAVNLVPNAQIASSNGTALTCAVSSLTLTASGAGAGGSYLWSTGATTDAISVTASGTYTVTATAANGCTDTESIIITSDAAMPVVLVNGTANGTTAICNGTSTTLTAAGADTYTWSPATGLSATTGASVTANPTTTTTYTVTGSAGAGCTGQTTVTITVNLTYNTTTDEVTICETELPYTYHNGQQFTTGGHHTVMFFSVSGCDSIVDLNIIVNAVAQTTDEQNVCKSEFESGWRYQDAAFGIDTTFRASTVSGDYVFYGYCKVKTLTLNVLEAVNSEYPQMPLQICADDEFFYIQIEPTGAAGDVTATDFEVIFDAASGFVTPQTGTVEGGNKIRVNVPDGIYPDNYFCKIILSNPASCSSKTFDNVPFKVYYPNTIMQQKWNNVIALKNEYYNGGYQFIGYQWYRNGYMMAGENNSYIYLGQGNMFNVSDSYYIELTRSGGSKMFSCPILLEVRAEDPDVFPTVVSGGGNITVRYSSPRRATANIYTVTGVLVGSANLSGEQQTHTIGAPTQQGTYLLEILTQGDSAERRIFPIVVNRR